MNINTVNSDLLVADFILPNREWDRLKLASMVPHSLAMKMQGLPILTTDLEDTPIRGVTSLGKFYVKSATWIARGLGNFPQNWHHNWIRKVDIPPKIAIFL